MSKRTKEDITAAEQEFFDLVWYNRKLVMAERIREGLETRPPEDVMKTMLLAMSEVQKKYPGKTGPHDDFEWGVINGKLSALRWVLGGDWDMLDT